MNFLRKLFLFSTILIGWSSAQESKFPENYDLLKSPFSLHENLNEFKSFKVPQSRFRLPLSFIPYHYEVKVRPILEDILDDDPQYSAPGNVNIFGTCATPTSNVTLHSSVVVDEASVKVVNLATSEEVPVTGHSYDEEKTFYIIELGESLLVGNQYSISIEYMAQVNTEVQEGMYLNHYDDPISGEKKYSVASQLQAFGARRVFPCMDEPALKATFSITLGRRTNYTTICNSPLVESIPIPEFEGWFWDVYNETVKMPTYLIAIIVADFTYDEANPLIYRKPVKTFGPKHLMDQGYGEIASDIAARVLYFFENFFDVEYAMHKMDSVGIIDFPAGAMENWGLNIYLENYLLYSAANDNERDRRGVAFTLNHELAHQWFGNLMTCDWWTMAWLNEGFATYLSYVGMEYTNPEYDSMKLLQYERTHVSFRNDDREDSHPTVLPEKGNPWDTMSYNANLVYSKGASILWMMEGFLTRQTLQKGLHTFLKAFSFEAANQDQLFQILTSQANEDNRLPVGATIKAIMDTWTLQRRYPVVKVSTAENSVVLTQTQYKPDNESRIYYIPIAISSQSSPNTGNTLPQYWLWTQPNGITVDHNESEWIVVNNGGTGYYRVEYDDVLTERLQEQLVSDHQLIALGTRSQLFDDYFTFAYDNGEGIEAALGFTKYLEKETESSVWYSFLYHMSKAGELLTGSAYATAFQNYMNPRLSGALTSLQNSGADLKVGEANLYYSTLLQWISATNGSAFDDVAFAFYENWKQNPSNNPIPPLLRTSIHRTAIGRSASNDNFFFAIAQYDSEPSRSRNEILNGLGMRSDPGAISLLLGVLDGTTSGLPASGVISSLAFNSNNREPLLNFMDQRFTQIVQANGVGTILQGVDSLCRRFATAEDKTKIDNFISKYAAQFSTEEMTRLENSVALLVGNIHWMMTFGDDMGEFFTNNK